MSISNGKIIVNYTCPLFRKREDNSEYHVSDQTFNLIQAVWANKVINVKNIKDVMGESCTLYNYEDDQEKLDFFENVELFKSSHSRGVGKGHFFG